MAGMLLSSGHEHDGHLVCYKRASFRALSSARGRVGTLFGNPVSASGPRGAVILGLVSLH